MKMKKIYLDNAATTPIDPEVVRAMIPVLEENYGNPSSTHAKGRESRSLIEMARKQIAKTLNCTPSEIFFTSGGTEADNQALRCSVSDLGVERIITSPLEHHAVLHTAEYLADCDKARVDLVKVNDRGEIDMNHLAELLEEEIPTLVSLMHANNEIGNLIDLREIGELCHSKGAYFHSDTVQSMAHYAFDLSDFPVDFLTCSAHKFHGPKGIGFLYVNKRVKLHAFIHGGSQERNMRGGTENLYGIVGLAKAFELSYSHLEAHQKHIRELKAYMIDRLKDTIPGVEFNGLSGEMDRSLYTVLSVSLPPSKLGGMLLFNLDIYGICASGGSACSSGSNIGSHVLKGIGANPDRPAIRFSFGRFNTIDDVDYTVEKLAGLYADAEVKVQ